MKVYPKMDLFYPRGPDLNRDLFKPRLLSSKVNRFTETPPVIVINLPTTRSSREQALPTNITSSVASDKIEFQVDTLVGKTDSLN